MLALCLMLSETYCARNYAGIIGLGLVSKCQFLARPNVLIVQLEYNNLFQSEWQHDITI